MTGIPNNAKPIPGFEGRYWITTSGEIWSVAKVGYGQLDINDQEPHRLNPSLSNGYLVVGLRRGGKSLQRTVHTLVAEVFLGYIRGSGLVVRHYDGIKVNNDVSNLRVGTQRENLLDTVRHGHHAYARRDHCKRGHIFTEENTSYRPDRAGRVCRECRKAHQKMSGHQRATVNRVLRMIFLAQRVIPGGENGRPAIQFKS